MPAYVYQHTEKRPGGTVYRGVYGRSSRSDFFECEHEVELCRSVAERDEPVMCPECDNPMERNPFPGGTSFIMSPWF